LVVEYTNQKGMRLFVRFYPVAESCSVELTEKDKFTTLLEQLYGLTNLVKGDKMKVIHNNITVSNFDASLSDYDVKENDTFNIIILHMKNEKIHLKTQRNYGLTGKLSDTELVNVFAFCDAKDLTTTTAVCRPWRNVSNQNELLWAFNCAVLFLQDTSSKETTSEEEKGDDEDEDEKDEKETNEKEKKKGAPVLRSIAFTDSDPKYFQWYLERTALKKNWKHAEKFSVNKPEKFEPLSKSKIFLIQKPPKALNEEETQFLAENNVAEMRKLVRKKKGMSKKSFSF
jgi:hypothetical protein